MQVPEVRAEGDGSAVVVVVRVHGDPLPVVFAATQRGALLLQYQSLLVIAAPRVSVRGLQWRRSSR
jgi:hypothetical protein